MATEFTKDFVIKGFVQEPMAGSSTIGWKQVFIGKSDFQKLLELCSLSQTNIQKRSYYDVNISGRRKHTFFIKISKTA